MQTRNSSTMLVALALLLAAAGHAQVPVDDDGNIIDSRAYPDPGTGAPATGEEGIPLLDPADLEELVGPIALYPDDLLAVVLPASTYPLQIVQAARFLEDLKSDPTLEPDPDWDDSIVALINYPEALALLNDDLDWTWRLGEAVVAQQADVLDAVEGFRNRAYAAGNLRSDGYQNVTRDEGIIEITPVTREIMYVPYYEPERVVHYQSRPVYHYYPVPCPVYYYPYPAGYGFHRRHFWGVTTAFTIGWTSNHLRVFHHSYHGHPYFGVRYWDRWWYRQPHISAHKNVYINRNVTVTRNRYSAGDEWRPRRDTRLRYSDQRIVRNADRTRRDAATDVRWRTADERPRPVERTAATNPPRPSLAPSRRGSIVSQREQIVAERGRAVQPRAAAGVPRQPSADRHAGQRLTVNDGRRRHAIREPSPRPPANDARRGRSGLPGDHARQSGERRAQAEPRRPAQSTERRQPAVNSNERRSGKQPQRNSPRRDSRHRR